jgi:hypothetical protein
VVTKEAIITVFICDTHATGCTHPQARKSAKRCSQTYDDDDDDDDINFTFLIFIFS